MKVSDIIIWERNFWYKIENNGKWKSFTAWGIEKQNSNLLFWSSIGSNISNGHEIEIMY